MAFETIATTLQSLKIATEFANYFKTANLDLEKAEQKMKVAELLGSLAELKMNLASVQEETIEMEKKNALLKEKLKLKDKLKFERPFYWIQESKTKEGPFCPPCYDDKGKQVRLQNLNNSYWQCPASECQFGAEDQTFENTHPRQYITDSDYDPLNH